MSPLVSVIMPAYNSERYITDAIESVVQQTYTNWELIVIDDGSSDGTVRRIEEQAARDLRIRFYKNEKNIGVSETRNRAISLANGEWVAFLDSDDIWMAEKLEKQLLFMKKKGYFFSYTNYEEIDNESVQTGVKVTGPRRITKMGMYNYCWPGCLTVMYDADKIGLIQIKNIKKNNDYAMWLKVCKKANCYLLDECLAQYRKGRVGSISTNSIKTMIRWHYKLFREAEEQGRIRSIINTGRNLLFGFYKKHKYVVR